MKVLSDNTAHVTRHYRTIEFADGPVVDAGEGPMSNYYTGTLIKADTLKQEWTGDREPETVLVSGDYVGVRESVRQRYDIRYRAKDGYPDWIKEIL